MQPAKVRGSAWMLGCERWRDDGASGGGGSAMTRPRMRETVFRHLRSR